MRAIIPIALAMTLLLTACRVPKTQPQQAELVGTWKTGLVRTEWGLAVLEVTFHDASELEFRMTPAQSQESMVSKGPYTLNGHQLISQAINKGEPVSIWFENKRLVIQTPSQPPQIFTRQ